MLKRDADVMIYFISPNCFSFYISGQPSPTSKDKSPMSEVLGLLHKTPLKPLMKPFSRSTVKLHNLFTKPLGSKSFQSVFTKTMQSIGEDFDKSVQTMSNTIVTSGKIFSKLYSYFIASVTNLRSVF